MPFASVCLLITRLERQVAEMGGAGAAHSPLSGPPTTANGELGLAADKAE